MPRRKKPERDVKRAIDRFLDALPCCYYRKHVPTGYNNPGIDYEGCVRGAFFGIEAKSPDPDADLTPRQRDTCLEILAGGGSAFVISCDDGLRAFQQWAYKQCFRT